MKNYIFNIGLNKSGTTSLTHALKILQIFALHYDYKKIPLENIIAENREKNINLFKGLDHMYQAFSDFGGEHCYQELYYQYPNSKFILTTRPFKDWLNSLIAMKEVIYPEEFQSAEKQKQCYLDAIYTYYDKGNEIKNFFKDKSNQFIELKICEGHGWKELCNFLDVPIPEIPFPWINKTIEFKEKNA